MAAKNPYPGLEGELRQTNARGPCDNNPCARPLWIDLTDMLREGQLVYTVFSAGSSQCILCVDAEDLKSFSAFQRRVAGELGLQPPCE